MYESPIMLYSLPFETNIIEDILNMVQRYEIKIDKVELLRALKYDRDQYHKGYNDALLERMSYWTISPYDGKFMCNHCYDVSNEKTLYCSYCGYRMTNKVPKLHGGTDND